MQEDCVRRQVFSALVLLQVSFHPLDYHSLMSIVDSLSDSKLKVPAQAGVRMWSDSNGRRKTIVEEQLSLF